MKANDLSYHVGALKKEKKENRPTFHLEFLTHSF